MVAALRTSWRSLEMVRDPTGSPVSIKLRTMDCRISRYRDVRGIPVAIAEAVRNSPLSLHCNRLKVKGQYQQAGRAYQDRLRHLLHFTGSDTGRTDAQALTSAVHQGSHRLEVEVPAAISDIVGVADAVAKLGSAAANFTNLCHKTEISRMIRTHSIAKTLLRCSPRIL